MSHQKLTAKFPTEFRGARGMSAPSLLTGQRFGRWTVLAMSSERRGRKRSVLWRCRCDCGTERLVVEESLIRNRSKSCGCARREASSKFLLKYHKLRPRRLQAWACDCGDHWFAKLTKAFITLVRHKMLT
jgi:hypothetical protein